MLGLTTFLTTDVAPVPLFWVVPLTLYLLSFALVFARRQVIPHALMLRALPLLALVLVTVLVFASQLSPLVQGPLHLLTFFAAAMVCHGELARSRPRAPGSRSSTCWFRSVASWGALQRARRARRLSDGRRVPAGDRAGVRGGGLRGSDSRPASGRLWQRGLDVAVPIALGVLVSCCCRRLPRATRGIRWHSCCCTSRRRSFCFSLKGRPVRFALGLAALMASSSVFLSAHQPVALRGRSYYSVFKVVTDPTRNLRLLVHARTVHGAQSLDPARAREPLTYYHRTGPIGQAFETFAARSPRRTSPSSDSAPAHWPPTASRSSTGRSTRSIRRLRRWRATRSTSRTSATRGRTSVSSSATPVYRWRRSPTQGWTFWSSTPSGRTPSRCICSRARRCGSTCARCSHAASSRFICRIGTWICSRSSEDLANAAGLTAFAQDQRDVSAAEEETGKAPSTWVVVARSPADLGGLVTDSRWRRLQPQPRPRVWTDDFSNPLSVMRWF